MLYFLLWVVDQAIPRTYPCQGSDEAVWRRSRWNSSGRQVAAAAWPALAGQPRTPLHLVRQKHALVHPHTCGNFWLFCDNEIPYVLSRTWSPTSIAWWRSPPLWIWHVRECLAQNYGVHKWRYGRTRQGTPWHL